MGSLLQLDEVRSGRPEILSGSAQLDRRVRWVHVADSEGVGALIEGGELVLSTAAGFRGSVVRVRRFLEDLEEGGAAGVIVELVDSHGRPDDPSVAIAREAAAGLALPVVVLRRQVKFVRVTQAAHRLLIGAQLTRVERSRRVHEVFTRLNLESADEQQILGTTARLLDRSVVLEDVAHRVLLNAAPEGVSRAGEEAAIGDWSASTEHAQVAVGAAGHVWGRLVAPGLDPADVEAILVLERAGQALTLARMAARDEADLLQRAQAGFLQALMADDLREDEARSRAAALGLRDADVYVPVAVHVTPARDEDLAQLQVRERALMEGWLSAARPSVDSVVAAGLRTGTFALLLGMRREADVDETLTRLVARVDSRAHRARTVSHDGPARGGHPASVAGGAWTVGAGPARDSLTGGADSIHEAAQVARAAAATQTRELPFYRFADVRLRGLVALMAEDPRLRTFAEAELGPLLAGPRWALDLLELYLRYGGNKSEVARAGHLSRQALYARLRRLESSLGVSLDDPESRAALHVALLWRRLQTGSSQSRV